MKLLFEVPPRPPFRAPDVQPPLGGVRDRPVAAGVGGRGRQDRRRRVAGEQVDGCARDGRARIGVDEVCEWLVDYLTSGPVVAMVLQGPHAISVVRKIAGHTYPEEAQAGTIRGDYSIDSTDIANEKKRSTRNLVHASGNSEEAKFEEELWFHKNEIHSYKRSDEDVIF